MVSPVSQVSSTISTRLASDGHGCEVALQDARDHGTRDGPGLGDPDHELRVVVAEDLERQRPAQLAEERPVHLEDTAGWLPSGAHVLRGRAQRRGGHRLRSYIANVRS